MSNKSDSFGKARDYAFLLLKFRLRSEKEIRERLIRKKFDIAVINEVVKFLKARNFIDDNVFAKTWIESRLKKPLGIRRLKQELNAKGIDSSIIEENAQELTKDYSEAEIVERIAKGRLNRLKKIEPQKAKMRLYGWLLRRGFSPEIISDCLSQVCKHTY